LQVKIETAIGFFMILAVAVFLFISFRIGIWRLDTVKYARYITYFSDVSGLNEKSDVVIAGVKAGWVDSLSLVNRNRQVRVDIMIDRSSVIYANGYALIRQNGLLGSKYVEIVPGDPSYPLLPAGSTLMQPNRPTVAIDELLVTFKEIADNVNKISASIKNVIGDEDNAANFMNTFSGSAKGAFRSFEKMAENTNRILQTSERNITTLVADLSNVVGKLRDTLPQAVDTLGDSSRKISNSIEIVSSSIDSTVRPLKETMDSINSGKGLIGALVKDECLAKDVRSTVDNVKDYFGYMGGLSLDVDAHLESMHGRGYDLDFKDAKGYFNFLIRPTDDFYYLAGLTSSYAGVVKRYREDKLFFNQDKHELVPDSMSLSDWERLDSAPVTEKYVREYGALTFNLQFAKEIGRLGCRLGIFENSFGFGVDYDVPLMGDAKWVSSLELFKFNEFVSHTLSGRLVADIDMPHLKWYNKIFFNDSCYFVFGADDFISKFNKNFFVGFGLSFEQDDLKYLASKVNLS
jgi:phospholipid/cholesterol/gamma-HCH transport system substrate-binding protein